jgi:tRNA(Ile)-lysidine synthase
VIPFIRKVRETIARYQMLTPRDRVVIGVSGGADSTALLLTLRDLEYEVAVAHLNHGLRGSESDADERFVQELAARLGVRCFTQSATIRIAEGNIEAAGREARRSFFSSLCDQHGFTKIALAHNREDRVETFLLHLMRGAGSEGLVSMSPVGATTIRPLIETPRSEIESFLRDRGQVWRTDSTNMDISFARNRMRREIIPHLASLFNTRLTDTLSRTITILQEEDQWMREIAESWLDTQGANGLDVASLEKCPPALERRLIRGALRRAGCDLRDLTFEHVESVRALLRPGKSGKTIPLPGGIRATREFNRLMLLTAESPAAEFNYELEIPGTVRVPELGRVFRATCLKVPAGAVALSVGSERVLVDGDGLGACVKIRNWKPGDYYKPAGWPAGKVKKLFQRARVPRSQRGRWPVFVSDSTIIWVTSFPVSREFTPSTCTKKVVAFEALEG